jgi:16S rRNA (adenine1518-N6/adenine1519-N6)-dimethyltransferase
MIDDLPPLRDVIARHGLDAKRNLGQNFILDLNLTARIARSAAPLTGRTIVEIGPGPGGLTRALLAEGADRVVAVERDERCLPALAEIAARYPGRLQVVSADATSVDWRALVQGPAAIVANLPYNVASLLLVDWLTKGPWPPWYESMTLMFQKEVAERLVATPSSKAYGRLSVLTQFRATPKLLFTLPPSAFKPSPKVESAMVRIVPLPLAADAPSIEALGRVTQAAFGQRRKMLRSSLKTLTPMPELLLAKAGIDPTHRAEQLSIAQFTALTKAWDCAR